MSLTAAPVDSTGGVSSTNHRVLDEAGRRRAAEAARERGTACRCGATDFAVGDALEMGSIWPDEELGTYLVALTCSRCGARDGIRLYDM